MMIEEWVSAPTEEDALLRELLHQDLCFLDAVRFLDKNFPSGSCKKEVENFMAEKNVKAEQAVIQIYKKLREEG